MNRMPFLHTKSSNITFFKAEYCISNSADNIVKELKTVNNMYKKKGLNIYIFHRYNYFNLNDFRTHIRPASLNIFEKDDRFPSSRGPYKPSIKERSETQTLCPKRDTRSS